MDQVHQVGAAWTAALPSPRGAPHTGVLPCGHCRPSCSVVTLQGVLEEVGRLRAASWTAADPVPRHPQAQRGSGERAMGTGLSTARCLRLQKQL